MGIKFQAREVPMLMLQPRYRCRRLENTLRGVGRERRLPRFEFQADVHILPYDGRERPFWGRTDDICHRGLFVRSRRQIPIGTLIVIKVCTEMGMLKFSCKVVHCIDKAGFGCEFIDLNSRQETALSFLIAMLNSAPMPLRRIQY
jgi:hypothetical protein